MVKANQSLDQTLALQKKFLKAFEDTNGIIAPACEKINITRRTYYNWLEKYPDFKQAVEDIDERQIDFVESKLQEGVLKGVPGLISFYLSTKGKKRGYITKLQSEAQDAEEFTTEDQSLMDEYAIRRVKELEHKDETPNEKLKRLKAEAILAEENEDDFM